ncbi:DUF1015 domain-containing protein [Conexibacter stalactiti]|uniref:DUF1015 domain-containing protein n=1 Tax=Conexibacter stalactiti TaxID=1940611 RepID=A0ABU4HKU5_9ACTN|nr:DUF1015 domain-containing protein [Conexibacter stalactiti]MDW5593920.1 DUF1015 domain-containing protein [Conexibacter stalactiti]MEC5034562.1 DUF1015 domain-containing protein [Conexibacter stalactiti]
MAEILPLTALHYDLATAGPLQALAAPPYDVIDEEQRAELAAQSPYNVVHLDLPAPPPAGDGTGDQYDHAAQLLESWRAEKALVRDPVPAIWPLQQEYVGPDGRRRIRNGFLCRVRVEPYGAGRIRPHERTHPGPKEDRLRLTRATRANLSPIFSLYSDPGSTAWSALTPHVRTTAPFAETQDADGTVNRLWRVTEPNALETVVEAVAEAELLIADGHHRYETARVYAEEIGGEGPHRWVLMCLVALEDPGLTVFPTHRLVSGIESDPDRQDALDRVIREQFDVSELPDRGSLVPDPRGGDERVQFGYMDARGQVPYLLALKEESIAEDLLGGRSEAYQRLDTAVLEAVILKHALGMSDEQIDHRDGLDYARDFEEALDLLDSEEVDAGFFMAPTPIEQVQEVAEAGESMPPKSTYFFPKVPTGLLFNPLFD